MNKQQLASLIWDYCNGLRGSISTVEYKDVILGFIFYRYLSECEEKDLLSMDWTYEDMETDLNEEDEETVKHCQSKWGYFIKYDYLFSTWYKKLETDFNVSLVTDALPPNWLRDLLRDTTVYPLTSFGLLTLKRARKSLR